jgi:hypothetical protein
MLVSGICPRLGRTMLRTAFALFAVALLFPTAVNAEMSEQDRLARCATNQAEIERLQTQINGTPGYLSMEQVARAKAVIKGLTRFEPLSNWGEERQYIGSGEGALQLAELLGTSKAFLPNDQPCLHMALECVTVTEARLNDALVQAAEAGPRVQPLLDQIAQRKERLIELQCVPVPPPEGVTPSGWQDAGSGDCSGDDEASTSGPVPDPGLCTPDRAGKAAVCWDGKTFINKYGESHGAPDYPWCTYKSTGDCGGGSNTGRLYYCRP